MMRDIVERQATMKPFFSEESKSFLRALLTHNVIKYNNSDSPRKD
jgi:hypothetical protein